MSIVKTVKTIYDTATFTLNEADLTGKKVGDSCVTPERDVPCTDGLRWWIQWYPSGIDDDVRDHISLFLYVNKAMKVKCTFVVDDSSIEETFTYSFVDVTQGNGYHDFASHEELRPIFRIGKLTITCDVEFDISVPYICVKPCLFLSSDDVPTDLELVMEFGSVPVHKSLLMLMSPVFNAMFTHDTAESKSNKVKITDFDYETVQTAIDFCYGREFENPCIETFLGILRFADKYDIAAVTSQMDKVPELNLDVDSFCPIVQYAYECSKDELFQECCKYFKEHQDKIKATEKFTKLPPALAVTVLETAFDLKSDFDVLRHALKEGMTFVVEHLEQNCLENISLDIFCPTVSYAWDCERDALKKGCAKFIKDNRDGILKLKDFHELPAETLREILKLWCDVENAVE